MRKASEAAQRRCFGRQCANTAHTSVSAASVPKASSRAVHWWAGIAVQVSPARRHRVASLASTAPRPDCSLRPRPGAWPRPVTRPARASQARTSIFCKRAARLGVTRTHARRSSAQIVRSPISCAPRLQCPGIWSVRSGAHSGRARTKAALTAALRLVVTIRRTRHRHFVRRCPHRRQSCRQSRRHPQARVPQSRNHQRRYRNHQCPSPHMRHCLGHRHPHRSRRS